MIIPQSHALPPPIAVPADTAEPATLLFIKTMTDPGDLVHNHPSGDLQPSTGDIHLTHQIIAVGKPLKVAVHDHLIIGKRGHASLKGLRII